MFFCESVKDGDVITIKLKEKYFENTEDGQE